MMDTVWFFVLLAFTGALGGCIGFIAGYELAVKETEKRWSEAVNRADYYRKFG